MRLWTIFLFEYNSFFIHLYFCSKIYCQLKFYFNPNLKKLFNSNFLQNRFVFEFMELSQSFLSNSSSTIEADK